MVDDLYERYAQSAVDAAARLAFEQGLNVGREQGFADGYTAGEAIGFVAGVQSVASALSEGTRFGSPKCARSLESLKRIGAVEDTE